MRQYLDVKRQHRDAIVFFRMGDFYEMFYEDALTAARALELTLTSRAKDSSGEAIPMCGVPYHAAETYITRLIRKGYRVAICDQVEDPRKAKGIVKREVTRVVSPGTFTDGSYLDARETALLAAIAPGGNGSGAGLAIVDVSTGEFVAAEFHGRGRAGVARGRSRPAPPAGSARRRRVRRGAAPDRMWTRPGAGDARRVVDLRALARHVRRSASSCGRHRWPDMASSTRPPRCRRPAPSCRTCATRSAGP